MAYKIFDCFRLGIYLAFAEIRHYYQLYLKPYEPLSKR